MGTPISEVDYFLNPLYFKGVRLLFFCQSRIVRSWFQVGHGPRDFLYVTKTLIPYRIIRYEPVIFVWFPVINHTKYGFWVDTVSYNTIRYFSYPVPWFLRDFPWLITQILYDFVIAHPYKIPDWLFKNTRIIPDLDFFQNPI